MAADGSIIIETLLDDKEAKKELTKLNNRIKTLNNQIYTNQRLKMPLVEQSKQAAANLDLAMASLEKMKSASVGAYTAQQIAQQEETVKSLQYQYSKIQSRVEAYDRSISTATEKLNIVKEQAGAIQQNMAAAGVDTEKMAAAAKRASKGAMGFATQLKYAMSSILLYGALFQVFSKFTEWIGKVIKSNDAASASVGRLKAALLTLAQPIVGVVIPALTFLANTLVRIISVISSFISMIFGSTLEESADAAESLYNEANAIESVGSAAKKASKQLASFDEINKLSGDTAESGGGAGADVISPDFSEAGDLSWLEETLGKSAGWVTAALLIGGIALVAIGASTGRLSLVLAGLLMLGSAVTVGEETGVFADWAAALGLETAEQFVPMALTLGGIALIALGAAIANILVVIAGLGLIGAGVAVHLQPPTSRKNTENRPPICPCSGRARHVPGRGVHGIHRRKDLPLYERHQFQTGGLPPGLGGGNLMADEKCAYDPGRECLGLQKANMLEKQMNEWRAQSRETHKELFNRTRDLEKAEASRNEQYANIMEKLDELIAWKSAEQGTTKRRWDAIVDKSIWAVLAAVIAFLLARIGL